MDTYIEKGFRVLNGIVFLLAVLIWQFQFEFLNSFIGLVIPALFVLMWGHTRVRRPFLSSITFALIVLSFYSLPLTMDVVFSNLGTVVVIVIAALILRPGFDYIGICLYLIFGFYLFYLVDFAGGIGGLFTREILSLLNESYHSLEWVSIIMNVKWFILIAAYAIYLVKAAVTKEYIRVQLFHIIMSIFSLPFLLLPLIIAGYAYAIYKTVFQFAGIFRGVVKIEKNVLPTNSQPAVEKYIFKKAFTDAKMVMQTAFKQNITIRKDVYRSIRQHTNTYGKAVNFFLSIISYSAIITLITVGNLLIALASIVHYLVLAIYGAPIFTFWAIMYYGDTLYRKIHDISTVCPACYHHSDLPKYHCSTCHTGHDLLVPSKYGTLKRKCQCGEKIPASIFSGRSKLAASCHTCSEKINSNEATIIQIPIIGGKSTGKTSFVLSSMNAIEDISKKKDWTLRYPVAQFQGKVSSFFKNLKSGIRPLKTQSSLPVADYFGITTPKSKVEKMVYMYDPAGETFETSSDFKKQRYLESYDGLVFVIDPFSIQQVREKYQQEFNVNLVNPSYTDFENIFDRFLIELQESYGIKAHEKINKPVAIVMNKIDQVLNNEIGMETAKQLAASRDDVKSETDATNFLCKQFLAGVGMNNFLRKVENKLANYQFFAYSSYKMEQQDYSAEPLLWVLGELRKELKM